MATPVRGREDQIEANMIVDYLGCVTPSGRVLLSLGGIVEIGAGDEPLRVVLTHHGPPMAIGFGIDTEREFHPEKLEMLESFKVVTDLGDAITLRVALDFPEILASDQHEHFKLSLTLQHRGDEK